ncbi:MAG: hypothetical protein IJ433_05230, partial [Ruminococcus sp.]|nr:hypothetical protein [Ruminococcus sp.]
EKGQTYTYIYYLASDAKISSLDATTFYDTTGLKFIPAEEDDMFPNLKAPVYNDAIEGQVIYNFSNYKGVDFPIPADGVFTKDSVDNAVFVGQFEVIGEPGVYEINTALKVLGGAPNVKIIYNFEQVNEDVTVLTDGVIDGLEPVDPPTPPATEPEATEPEATEPEATEPEATEPEATEPEATEPEATEPEATKPSETQDGTQAPSAAKPTTSSSGSQTKPGNSSSVKTGSTEAAIAFITVLVMAAGVVMFARKKKFD